MAPLKHIRSTAAVGGGQVSGNSAGDSRRLSRRSLRRALCDRGQGVVEFAMVLPLLAALVFALVDFGKAIYYYIDLTHIANEGARIASVSQATLPGGATSLRQYLCREFGSRSELNTGSSSVDKATVTITYNNSTSNVGDPVTVSISTVYHWIPFFRLGTMNVSGSATMRVEDPPAATGTTVISAGSSQCP